MKMRFAAFVLAALTACGLVSATAADAPAATAYGHKGVTYVYFTHDETTRIALTGVASILDYKEVRSAWRAGPDRKSAFPRFYVRGRGVVPRATAQDLVTEAALHPNGRLIAAVRAQRNSPIALFTRW